MCMRKPVGEDEAIEMNEALAEKRDFTADDLEAARGKVAVRNVLFTGVYVLECMAAVVVYHRKRKK